MFEITSLERDAMEHLLAGDHPILEQLRHQYRASKVLWREETGVGVFVDFSLPEDVEPVCGRGRFQIADVDAEVEGLDHGAGFILFVTDGLLRCLETFVYADDQWPEDIGWYSFYYLRKAGFALERRQTRDWKALQRSLDSVEGRERSEDVKRLLGKIPVIRRIFGRTGDGNV